MGDYEVDLPVVLGCYQKWYRMIEWVGRIKRLIGGVRWDECGMTSNSLCELRIVLFSCSRRYKGTGGLPLKS